VKLARCYIFLIVDEKSAGCSEVVFPHYIKNSVAVFWLGFVAISKRS
jgi:hypothetical protein